MPPEAIGLLYDSTLCVGCKACVSACKQANHMPADIGAKQEAWNPGLWDSAVDLSGKTLNVIKVYGHGTMEKKDAETNGFAFSKRQCLHCVDPSCVSACPVTAMTKDPRTGIVRHDPGRCIGCRYCVLSCPFGVPKYDFSTTWGKIQKCQLCVQRLEKGQLPACADVCPTGATLFGRREDLLAEARRRLALKPGERVVFPRGDISQVIEPQPRPSHEAIQTVAYQQHVYGERELGGTQCLALSAVPFERLNLPTNLPDYGYPTLSEGIQETIYHNMVAPAVVLAGLLALTYRTARHPDDVPDPDTDPKMARYQGQDQGRGQGQNQGRQA
jgi:Fe-S-cluster-containing dehydrogenase component